VAELKTRPTRASVREFLAGLDPDTRRDCNALAKLMREATGEKAVMWGPSIVGFGSYHYRYPTGSEGDWMLTGFAPRKRNLSVYVMLGFEPYAALLAKLGKHRTAKSCLYLRSLADVDADVLRELLVRSVADLRAKYPA
jgi:hypothetical protein